MYRLLDPSNSVSQFLFYSTFTWMILGSLGGCHGKDLSATFPAQATPSTPQPNAAGGVHPPPNDGAATRQANQASIHEANDPVSPNPAAPSSALEDWEARIQAHRAEQAAQGKAGTAANPSPDPTDPPTPLEDWEARIQAHRAGEKLPGRASTQAPASPPPASTPTPLEDWEAPIQAHRKAQAQAQAADLFKKGEPVSVHFSPALALKHLREACKQGNTSLASKLLNTPHVRLSAELYTTLFSLAQAHQKIDILILLDFSYSRACLLQHMPDFRERWLRIAIQSQGALWEKNFIDLFTLYRKELPGDLAQQVAGYGARLDQWAQAAFPPACSQALLPELRKAPPKEWESILSCASKKQQEQQRLALVWNRVVQATHRKCTKRALKKFYTQVQAESLDEEGMRYTDRIPIVFEELMAARIPRDLYIAMASELVWLDAPARKASFQQLLASCAAAQCTTHQLAAYLATVNQKLVEASKGSLTAAAILDACQHSYALGACSLLKHRERCQVLLAKAYQRRAELSPAGYVHLLSLLHTLPSRQWNHIPLLEAINHTKAAKQEGDVQNVPAPVPPAGRTA